MSKVYNFSAGPSMLPESVLKQAQAEMLDWQGSGMSVMEMSHRGSEFMSIADTLHRDLRELMAIPDNYKLLFLQGGATAQFSFIPANILGNKTKACYVNTGAWSRKALEVAKSYCDVVVAASAEANNFTAIPNSSTWHIDQQAAYLHYTPNETIHGLEFAHVPEVDNLPLVADMSSNILSRQIDVSKFGLIYAGSQKNMGPAGVTVVIVREDLIAKAHPGVPDVFNYQQQVEHESMLNTPATYSWYLVGLVLQWLKAQGGISGIEQVNQRKAQNLYAAIDRSSLYSNPVASADRSRMNVPFILADKGLESAFLKAAQEQGFLALKGHRLLGGMRASIYNAMPESGVEALVQFMAEFERTH
ncbi:MAG: 3-phosphoserine/phosphohydroxythreonine transaminase [Methyloprofundus sp.]|nr:3-phosphoserine/phosphohydroxythreonine transaminase [Methyloprofundus sp.]